MILEVFYHVEVLFGYQFYGTIQWPTFLYRKTFYLFKVNFV